MTMYDGSSTAEAAMSGTAKVDERSSSRMAPTASGRPPPPQ